MQIVIGGQKHGVMAGQIAAMAKDATALCLAVSYIRLSGWRIFSELVKIAPEKIRIVCTDQLGVTDPAAVREALAQNVEIRRYTGSKIFHAKLYLAEHADKPTKFLIGSANMSDSALNSGVEVGVVGDDPGDCLKWFNHLFKNESTAFTSEALAAMDAAFTARVWTKISSLKRSRATERHLVSEDIIDGVFANLGDITPLNFDQGGNTVRNLNQALNVLQNENRTPKQRSEMNLLGFAQQGSINDLGRTASKAVTIEELAAIWVSWLKRTSITQCRPSAVMVAWRWRSTLLPDFGACNRM